MICIRSYLTLTNETLSNNSNKSILTIITHGRNMEIGDHKIMEFILSNQRQKAIFFSSAWNYVHLTRSGTNGRIVELFVFDPDIVRDESSPPPLLPSSNVPERSWFVSLKFVASVSPAVTFRRNRSIDEFVLTLANSSNREEEEFGIPKRINEISTWNTMR